MKYILGLLMLACVISSGFSHEIKAVDVNRLVLIEDTNTCNDDLVFQNGEILFANWWKKMFPSDDDGPWICPKCGYSNPAKTIMCRNCAFPFDSEIEGY